MAHVIKTTMGVVAVIYTIAAILYLFMSRFDKPNRKYVASILTIVVATVGASLYASESLGYGRIERIDDTNVVFSAHYYFEALQFGLIAVVISYCKEEGFPKAFCMGVCAAVWCVLHGMSAVAEDDFVRSWFFLGGLFSWGVVFCGLYYGQRGGSYFIYAKNSVYLYSFLSTAMHIGFVVGQFGLGWGGERFTVLWFAVIDVITILILGGYLRSCPDSDVSNSYPTPPQYPVPQMHPMVSEYPQGRGRVNPTDAWRK